MLRFSTSKLIFNRNLSSAIFRRQKQHLRIPSSSASLFITAPQLYQTPKWCSTTPPTATTTTESKPTATEEQQQTPASTVPALTNEQRAAFCAPPTVVTASNFEQIVMQSQLAMCLTYHVDNTRCRQYLSRIEESVNEVNIRVRHRWLSLMTCDADRNPTLAGAFSIERVKLPITFFVYSGTIIDKVNGAVPKERLNSILLRFMEYYQEQKGVELEDHGFVQGAKVENITEAVSAQEYEGKLEWMLLSKERIWSNPKELHSIVDKGMIQAGKDLRELQDQVGLNVKKIDPSELFASYYSKPAYLAAAKMAFFRALIHVIDTENLSTSKNLQDVIKVVKDTINEFKHGMARPTVRAVACVAQLRLAERQAKEQLMSIPNAKMTKAETSDETCVKSLELLPKWVQKIDTPGGLDGEFPQDTMDEMLVQYRQISMSVRKLSKQYKDDAELIEQVKLLQLLVGDCIRATLQLFPDDQRCNVARSRFAAMMH